MYPTTNIVFVGTKYQSNLNEIDKGKQKTDEGGGKMQHNWVGGASQVTGNFDLFVTLLALSASLVTAA